MSERPVGREGDDARAWWANGAARRSLGDSALPLDDTARPQRPVELVQRRRLGGTVEMVPATAPPSFDAAEPLAHGLPAAGTESGTGATLSRRRVRRRRARRWYRRPIFLLPLALLLFLVVGAGAVLERFGSTMATIRETSALPDVVVVPVDEVEAGVAGPVAGPTVAIDTGPARAAVAEAYGSDDEGSILSGFQDAASNAGDLADGAAVAAGVADAPDDALTILLIGVDARPGAPIDVAVRADTLMVLRLDPVARTCRLLSIPRDSRVELPGYGQTKVNHALMVGGIQYQRLVVERLLGVPIDRYALIDFAGFRELVDAVGGVRVTVPQEIRRGEQLLFAAGPQTFDGEQALAYARYRGGPDGDLGRIRRQQQVIRGLLAVAAGRDVARDVDELLPAVEDHVRTDLGSAEMVGLAEEYRGTCDDGGLEMRRPEGQISDREIADPLLQDDLTYFLLDEASLREQVAWLTGARAA